LHVLLYIVCYSFHQKCSKLDTFTDQGTIKLSKTVVNDTLGCCKKGFKRKVIKIKSAKALRTPTNELRQFL
jgi:hypothetical protein